MFNIESMSLWKCQNLYVSSVTGSSPLVRLLPKRLPHNKFPHPICVRVRVMVRFNVGGNLLGGNFPGVNFLCTCFVCKEKFLKSDGVKSNDKNMIKSNDGIPSHHGSENESTCFLGDSLTHFRPLLLFYTPWKHQKTRGFLMFSGGIKWDYWPKMD